MKGFYRVKQRETDREVLDRITPRASRLSARPAARSVRAPPSTSAARATPKTPAQPVPAGVSVGVKTALTLLYIPGGAALLMFWQLARPAMHHAIANIDIGLPRFTAAVFALLMTLFYPLLLAPFYLIWRRHRA